MILLVKVVTPRLLNNFFFQVLRAEPLAFCFCGDVLLAKQSEIVGVGVRDCFDAEINHVPHSVVKAGCLVNLVEDDIKRSLQVE